MRIAAVICNVVFFVFLCLVLVTDGPPKGAAYIVFSLISVLVPILNVVVIGVLSSPSRVVSLVAFVSNIVLLGFTCWAIVDQYPHPEESGVVEFTVLMLLTPVLSAVAIYRGLRVAHGSTR